MLKIFFSTIHHRVIPRYKRSSGSLLDSHELIKGQRRKMSDPDVPHRIDSNARSEPIAIPPAATSPIVSPHAEGKFYLLINKICIVI